MTSNDLFKTIKSANKTQDETKLATVSSITDGKIYLQFYGETEPSMKPYKRIDSYTPAVGDVVVLNRVGNSYIINGKVV